MFLSGRVGWDEWLGYSAQAVVLLALALLGGVCLLRPQMIVAFLQPRYHTSRLMRMTLFSTQIFKPWYPILVRCWGLLIWAFLTLVALALTGTI